MTPVRLEPAAPRLRVKHSITEPPRCLYFECYRKAIDLASFFIFCGWVWYFIASIPDLCLLPLTWIFRVALSVLRGEPRKSLLFQSAGIACYITFHYSFPLIFSMSFVPHLRSLDERFSFRA